MTIRTFLFFYLFFFINSISVCYGNDCDQKNGCMSDMAIENAQENRVKDSSSLLFSCMMSNWHAEFNENKSNLNENVEVYNVYGYERFLACYRSASGHGAAGEIGVDREKRKVHNGTRFRAEVICNNEKCNTTWIDSDCCYDLDLQKY